MLTSSGFCLYTAGCKSALRTEALGTSLQRGTDMIVDAETFTEIENAVTQATQGLGAATQLVKGLGPQTEEARAYISRLLNQILEVQIYVQRAGAVLDAVKEANQEESSHQ